MRVLLLCVESRAPRTDAMKVLREEGKCIAFKPVIESHVQ